MTSPPTSFDDQYQNALLATGALQVALDYAANAFDTINYVHLVTDRAGNGTSQLEIEFTFLKTPYLVTVEQLL